MNLIVVLLCLHFDLSGYCLEKFIYEYPTKKLPTLFPRIDHNRSYEVYVEYIVSGDNSYVDYLVCTAYVIVGLGMEK